MKVMRSRGGLENKTVRRRDVSDVRKDEEGWVEGFEAFHQPDNLF